MHVYCALHTLTFVGYCDTWAYDLCGGNDWKKMSALCVSQEYTGERGEVKGMEG